MDFPELREEMVKCQLAGRGIRDAKVLAAFTKVPRHKFVPEELAVSGYEDHPLPVGENQTISQPYMVALMTECLEIEPEDKILEIGTGSGYQAAILAELAKEVYSIERFPALAINAEEILAELGYTNVKVKTADGTLGWKEYAPFDGIIITAASPKIPQPLIDQLKSDAKLVIPIGTGFSQSLTVVEKINGKLKFREVCSCVFVPLIGEYGWKE